MTNEPSNERPWTEDEWERFMQKSEVRAAKFGELLETLHDNPDCDETIAREMGWKWDEREDDSGFESPDLEGLDSAEDWDESQQHEDQSLSAIPAYARGFEWSLSVHRALQEQLEGESELDPLDPLFIAISDSQIVAAKIAGGHGMGYDDEALCGNIVCCKRSLEAAERSVAALNDLAERGIVPTETIQPLVEEGRLVQELVQQHVAQLRSRVWWE